MVIASRGAFDALCQSSLDVSLGLFGYDLVRSDTASFGPPIPPIGGPDWLAAIDQV